MEATPAPVPGRQIHRPSARSLSRARQLGNSPKWLHGDLSSNGLRPGIMARERAMRPRSLHPDPLPEEFGWGEAGPDPVQPSFSDS